MIINIFLYNIWARPRKLLLLLYIYIYIYKYIDKYIDKIDIIIISYNDKWEITSKWMVRTILRKRCTSKNPQLWLRIVNQPANTSFPPLPRTFSIYSTIIHIWMDHHANIFLELDFGNYYSQCLYKLPSSEK